MCRARINWLQAQLEAGQGPMIVLAHHHMLASGFEGMDEIKLSNGLAIAKIIAGSNRCQMVIKSPCHETPMNLGAGASSLSVAEPGGYGLLLLDANSPVLHHVDVGLPNGPVEFDAVS